MLNFLELLFPGKAKLERELADMENDLQPLVVDLVDWDFKEMELMSLIQDNRKYNGGFVKSLQGNLNSIYHEHMAAYMWRKLSGIGDIELLLILTKKFRFEYVTKNGKTSMYIDKRFLGEIKSDNVIYTSKRQAIAKIDINSTEWWPIYFNEDKLGNLVNIERAREVNPRAFYMGRELTKDEEAVFLCVAFYIMIDKTKALRKLRFR